MSYIAPQVQILLDTIAEANAPELNTFPINEARAKLSKFWKNINTEASPVYNIKEIQIHN